MAQTELASTHRAIPLKKWLWNSYISAALIPLLLIELTFLGIYWGTGEFVYKRGAEAVTELSQAALSDAATREAQTISRRLATVEALTKVYADATGDALQQPADVTQAEMDRHAYSPDGVFYTTQDNGGAAVFYSGIVPIEEAEQDKVWRTVRLDPLMKSIVGADPLIAQAYLNTHDSLNRIYPYFDVLDIFPPKMDIPSYNFYYEADEVHNPKGEVVWTDAYIDPAGAGWMVSSIAPVMGPEKLEAVVGIDITIKTIVDQVLDISLAGEGYAMLVGRDGTILALPPQGERDLGIEELLDHSYDQAILDDTFKPSEFNIFRRTDLAELALAMQDADSGIVDLEFDHPVMASWSTVDGPGWKLIAIANSDVLLTPSNKLRETLGLVSGIMLVALILFYSVYFAVLWKRASKMSASVAQPLAELESDMADISQGGRLSQQRVHSVAELQNVNKHLVSMSGKLAAASRAKSAFLSAMSHELRTPLNAILGYTQILQMAEGQKIDASKMADLDQIARSSTELLTMVEGVMDLSRIEQGDLSTSFEAVDTVPLVRQAYNGLRSMALEKGVTFDIDAQAGMDTTAMTDSGALSRILSQLISNAIKYNKAGGKVTVRLRDGDGDTLRIDVEDTGAGIAEDRQKDIFTPFERLGRENSDISGVGVGLSLTRRLVEVIGGDLSLKSTVGEGSTFSVRLPRP
ncbi:sensor histidine kinase [Donghicola sp.]|uniref:sensor histidine kinase n=1 Tax=Donghicola sp. TaxID=1929294 RepID=UPI0025EC3F82|nr:sensor histidine kinase [Donghicola sp.]MCT4576146.1 sensor histidine kinase [Donghicola sp.]